MGSKRETVDEFRSAIDAREFARAFRCTVDEPVWRAVASEAKGRAGIDRVWGHGAELARVGGTGHTGVPYTKGQSARFDRMNQTGFWDEVATGVMHPTDPRLRVAALDRDGLVGEVIYGVLGAANRIDDTTV